jgi:heat-inducible transcriptional repressor
LNDWLNLAASLLAEMVHNTAVVSAPKSASCRFKHLELVTLQDTLALVVLVVNGARVRQQLVTLEQATSQDKLTALAGKLSALYAGLTSHEISGRTKGPGLMEQKVTDYLLRMMDTEDERENAEPHLDGLHFLFSQPEFVSDRRLALSLMELIEGGRLLRDIVPPGFTGRKVQVIIGKENRAAPIHEYSVVLGRYGSPRQAAGTIGVIGPTRMPYARAIATVDFLASVLSRLISGLYGHPPHADDEGYREARN